jgi:hypothetical protein
MPMTLRLLLAAPTPEELAWKPSADRWSVSDTLAHLVDVELSFQQRCRQVVEEDNAVLNLYQPPRARRVAPGSRGRARPCLGRLARARRASVGWLCSLPFEAWRRTGHNSQLGIIRLDQIVCLWTFHDLGHLRQMAELLRAASWWEGMGPLQSGYRIDP